MKGATAACAGIGLLLLAFAATIDLPRLSGNFKGDEATYYSLTYSLARDFDFTFEPKDLHRVWEEYRGGPEGIFLKKGKTNRLTRSDRFPYVRRVKLEEERVATHLYYAKPFLFPLLASPFVFLFGTHGFLVFHALLLTLDVFLAYTFLVGRGSAPHAALAYALVFVFASIVPVYVIWMTPELLNFSLVLAALFLWAYKEGAANRPAGGAILFSEKSDYWAAAIIGVLTYAKPPQHAPLMAPLVLLALSRRQWRRAATMCAVWAVVTGASFTANLAITGEFNYQAGDRKTFYGRDGFPFANARETFENIGPVRERGSVMVGNVLTNQHTATVFGHNLVYFAVGRFSGFLPYFFPGVMSAVLFLMKRPRQLWQWLLAGAIVASIVVLLLLTPFTYSGGGGPVGNRYFFSLYALFLFLTPPLTGLGPAAIAQAVGAIFTAQILLNPVQASMRPGDHTKSGPLHALPIELTLLNDLPMAFTPDRSRLPFTGSPPMLVYFPDDNVFPPEGEWLWLRAKSRADIVLRAPVADIGGGQFVSKRITRLSVELENGGDPQNVTMTTGGESRTVSMKSAEIARFTLDMPSGVPYHRDENPTSYLYVVSIRTRAGFVPFLDAANSTDSRFLGAHVRLVPEYADAETTSWTPAGAR